MGKLNNVFANIYIGDIVFHINITLSDRKKNIKAIRVDNISSSQGHFLGNFVTVDFKKSKMRPWRSIEKDQILCVLSPEDMETIFTKFSIKRNKKSLYNFLLNSHEQVQIKYINSELMELNKELSIL